MRDSAAIKYQPATAADKKKFLKGDNAALQSKWKEVKEDDKQEGKQSKGEMLTGPFAIINPIPSIVGPLGEFQCIPENFPLHPAIVGFGKRRTGKSYTFRDVLFKAFRDIPFGICMTGTSYNGFWQKYIPSKFVFQGLNPQMMQALIDRQKKLVVKWRKDHPDAEPDDYKKDPALRAFIVLGKWSTYFDRVSFHLGAVPKQ